MTKTRVSFNGGKNKTLFKSMKRTKHIPNPYGREGKPSFMKSVIKGMGKFLESPFK